MVPSSTERDSPERGSNEERPAPVEHALDLGRYAGLGFQFAFVLLAFGAVGWWLDNLLGTRPWLLIGGIFLGAIGAFVALLRAVPAARSKTAAHTATTPERDREHDRP